MGGGSLMQKETIDTTLSSRQVVIVMRHGERRDGGFNMEPEVDPPLTERGIAQVKSVAEKISNFFGCEQARNMLIISSPFLRAQQTAQQLRRCDIGVSNKLLTDNRLCEVYGPLRIRTDVDPLFFDGVADSDTAGVPSWGETIEQATQRYLDAFYRNCSLYKNDNLLLVSHGDALAAILSAFYPMRTVYSAEYLSFIAFRKVLKSTSCNVLYSYELVMSDGVEWLTESPTTSHIWLCKLYEDTLSVDSNEMFDKDKILNDTIDKHGHLGSLTHATWGNSNNLTEGYSLRKKGLVVPLLVLRIFTICLQFLTIFTWSNKRNAAIYIFVLIVLEFMLIILKFNKSLFLKLSETFDTLVSFYQLKRLLARFICCRSNFGMLTCLPLFFMTAAKALCILVVSVLFGYILDIFIETSNNMLHSYADIFCCFENTLIYILFWALDMCQRYFYLSYSIGEAEN